MPDEMSKEEAQMHQAILWMRCACCKEHLGVKP